MILVCPACKSVSPVTIRDYMKSLCSETAKICQLCGCKRIPSKEDEKQIKTFFMRESNKKK